MESEPGEHQTLITYQSGIAWIAPGIFLMAAAMGALVLVVSFVQGGPVWFVALWFGLMAWIAFNAIVRSARSVEVWDGILVWRSWFTTQRVALKDVDRLSLAFGGTVQVIECRDGRRLRVALAQGYRPFIERLARTYPDLKIEGGRYAAFVDRVQLLRPPQDEQPFPPRGDAGRPG
jgi:hypothetical protein